MMQDANCSESIWAEACNSAVYLKNRCPHSGINYQLPEESWTNQKVDLSHHKIFGCKVHIPKQNTIPAIRRFMCRRRQPKEFRTDNGTNFVGAERELEEWIQGWNQNSISEELTSKGIIWKFNPPRVPHICGADGTICPTLKISLKTINTKEDVLTSFLAEIEYIVNSRPLTHISVDANKREALANSYWRRWVRGYRPTLIQRQKWHDKTIPIKVGDIVLVIDEEAPRNQWMIGRVEETYPAKDGIIRVVQLKNIEKTFLRLVAKLLFFL
ncbi:hypothetical protein JTB14_028893 [Gonioctena quinquepunctata]|nr:hypothetical protein JTB14_028893 [Gonioctena quinquepunctata]